MRRLCKVGQPDAFMNTHERYSLEETVTTVFQSRHNGDLLNTDRMIENIIAVVLTGQADMAIYINASLTSFPILLIRKRDRVGRANLK